MDQDDELADWKSKTYQLIGRNVLHFQRMEQLLKFLLPQATVSIFGKADLASFLEERSEEVRVCTLGTLVNRFLAEVCVPDEPTSVEESVEPKFTSTVRLVLDDPVGLESMRTRLKNLVEGRNHLVHDLISRIDANSVECWRSIHNDLEEQQQRTLAEIETFRQLVELLDVGRAFFASPEGQRELAYGPLRDRLIEKLRAEAGRSSDADGWTSLRAAIRSDGEVASDHINELLGHFDFRNLSAFLEAVGGFEIRHDKDQKGGTRTFYRVNGTQSPTATDSASH